jgi:hypothetical protein
MTKSHTPSNCEEDMRTEINPSLAYQLKRSLGNDHMPLEEAIRQAIAQAIEVRGLRIALHSAIVRPAGEIPACAERHVTEEELNYARICRPESTH